MIDAILGIRFKHNRSLGSGHDSRMPIREYLKNYFHTRQGCAFVDGVTIGVLAMCFLIFVLQLVGAIRISVASTWGQVI